MPEIISGDAVRHIALLSRLEFTEPEIRRFAAELNRILGYVEKLRELDTENVPPMSHPLRLTNVFREDTVRPSLPAEHALANAPEVEAGHFKVPQIIQG